MRVCKKCGVEKPLEEFYVSRGSKEGRMWKCKVCFNAQNKEYRNDPEVQKRRNLATSRWYKEPQNARRARLRKKYGMSLEGYTTLLDSQGGVCAICGKKQEGLRYTTLAVDHDHTTGEVRGLLCSNCNRAIGLLGDSFLTVWRAAYYLTRQKHKRQAG